jgi:hypothetical protein
MKDIKEQYMKYIARVQGAYPKTELGINMHNIMNSQMSLAQFSKEVTLTRLKGMQNDIPEIAQAARITQDKVYGPIGK